MCENVTFHLVAFVSCHVKRVDMTFKDFNSLIITLEALKSTYEVQSYRITAKNEPCVICLYESDDFCDYVETYEE